jgi:hypothetical protein
VEQLGIVPLAPEPEAPVEIGHRVEVAAERDQAVLADRPQMPLGHQVWSRRQEV